MWYEVLLEALLDTLKLAPVLLIVHIIIEIIETCGLTGKLEKTLNGGLSPLIGSGVGIIPQCGFSIVASDLYSRKKISLGALIAIFLATTDEAIPILLSSVQGLTQVWKIILAVLATSLVGGYLVFLVETLIKKLRKKRQVTPVGMTTVELEEYNNAVNDQVIEAQGERDENGNLVLGCHNHKLHEHNDNEVKQNKFVKFFKRYLQHPIIHTLTVLLYCLIVNVAFGYILFFIGEDKVTAFLQSSGYLQPLFAALVGLIPNCAGSVAITQLFAMGGLNLGGAVAGLCCGAGIGFAVLIKQNRPVYKTALIMLGIFVYAVLVGLLITAIGW